VKVKLSGPTITQNEKSKIKGEWVQFKSFHIPPNKRMWSKKGRSGFGQLPTGFRGENSPEENTVNAEDKKTHDPIQHRGTAATESRKSLVTSIFNRVEDSSVKKEWKDERMMGSS